MASYIMDEILKPSTFWKICRQRDHNFISGDGERAAGLDPDLDHTEKPAINTH